MLLKQILMNDLFCHDTNYSHVSKNLISLVSSHVDLFYTALIFILPFSECFLIILYTLKIYNILLK